MGRSPCCDKVGLKKGPWTPEEDQKLLAYIEEHGHGSWRALPTKAGLQRCGKSCRLRWTNYLRPDIKRGKFSIQEEQTIIQLHALLGNRWSAIATHLPKRTDNEIKNYWNTHLKKRLAKMGIDPVTHKPKTDALILSNDGHNKHAANLSHMAQWESARLEAEARLVRQSKLRSNSFHHNPLPSPDFISSPPPPPPPPPPLPGCLDILKAWNGVWSSSTTSTSSSIKPNIINDQSAAMAGGAVAADIGGGGGDLESPTSTLSYSENAPSGMNNNNNNNNNNNGDNSISTAFIELVGNNSSGNSCDGTGGGGIIIMKEEGGHEEDWKGAYGSSNGTGGINNIINIENNISMSSNLINSACCGAVGLPHNHHVVPMDTSDVDDDESDDDDDDVDVDEHVPFVERFTDLLLSSTTSSATAGATSEGCGDSSDNNVNAAVNTTEYLEDNKNYWNSILNLVNSSSPSDSAMF